MAKNKSKGSTKPEKMELVSFKLSASLYEQLRDYARTQTDESGAELSPSLAARRLMLESLKRSSLKK